MKDEEEIKNIILHEIGHLCADILMCKNVPGTKINELIVRNHGCVTDWCGYVEVLPKKLLNNSTEVNKSDTLIFYLLLSLINGCFFQVIFVKSKITTNECFESFGKRDSQNFYHLLPSVLSKYSVKKVDWSINFNFFKDLFIEDYKNKLIKQESFINNIIEIVDKQFLNLQEKYINEKEPKNFTYRVDSDNLNSLINELTKVMNDFDYIDLVEEIKNSFDEKIKELTICKQ